MKFKSDLEFAQFLRDEGLNGTSTYIYLNQAKRAVGALMRFEVSEILAYERKLPLSSAGQFARAWHYLCAFSRMRGRDIPNPFLKIRPDRPATAPKVDLAATVPKAVLDSIVQSVRAFRVRPDFCYDIDLRQEPNSDGCLHIETSGMLGRMPSPYPIDVRPLIAWRGKVGPPLVPGMTRRAFAKMVRDHMTNAKSPSDQSSSESSGSTMSVSDNSALGRSPGPSKA